MAILNYVQFTCSSVEDTICDEMGEVIAPGGKDLCEKLCGALSNNLVRCSNPLQRSHYGWEFELELPNRPYLVVLQSLGENQWLAIICRSWSFQSLLQMFRSPNASDARCVEEVHNALQSLDDVTGIQWFSRQELENGV